MAMRAPIVAFALGIWACQQLPALPPVGGRIGAGAALILFVAAAALMRRAAGWRHLVLAALALVAGLGWAAGRAEWRLADELPAEWERRDVVVTGVVADLPQPFERGVRFAFRVEEASAPVPQNIQLSWYAARRADPANAVPSVHAGERWRLTVRLKRPHGQANPHGFDYEAWLLERNLRATGYVRADPENGRLDEFVPEFMTVVHRLREAVRTRFAAQLSDAPLAGMIIALAIGDQRAIPQEQWDVFRRTGITHLVSISGLHVSMVGLLGAAVVGWLWRRSPALLLRVPARRAAALCGLALAVAYALLAGLGIPTQRTILMLGVVALAMVLGREALGSRVLALALLAVLLVDPWAVLSPGFWLSFAAVGVILYVVGGRSRPVTGWRAAVVVQLAITLALTPALLLLFNAFSLVSPVANAFAIPLVSFVVTPLALLAILVPFAPLLELAHWVAALMMAWLEWLAGSPLAMWQQATPPFALALAGMIGAAWLLLPRGTPARAVGALAMVPMLAWAPPRPFEGAFRATVLDVGHGMAVHVQTARHDLLYDTGPAYGPDTNAGERVVLPYLSATGVQGLDRVVISHDDIDHTGGGQALLSDMRVDELVSGLAPEHRLLVHEGVAASVCEAGRRWDWDGVAFEILHPAPDEVPFSRDNDNSCVLRVSAAGGSLLLAGDIEGAAERRLLARVGPALASSVVLVPHHGSRSSSTAGFVGAVQPQAAVFSVGYLNPFRHPHPAVWDRWEAAGSRNWRTDRQGAIHVAADAEGVRLAAERERNARYWHGR